jgi:RND superfamily putative drug exporter
VVVVIAAAAVGVGAFGKLLTGGFDDPASDSTRAAEIVDGRFGGDPNLVLLVTAASGTVDDSDVAAFGRRVTGELERERGVTNVASYWVRGGPPLRSADGTRALVVASVADDDLAADLVERYEDADEAPGVAAVVPGGPATADEDISGRVTADLATAESFAIPITLVLLVIAFGGLIAALLPLTIGLVGILGGFAALSLLAEVTDVSIFAVNLATALGLGLGIDYALLMVSRFREETAAGRGRAEAVAVTTQTAGRTILFSGLTVIVALSVMLVFPLFFLRSMAYAGIAVTAVAVLAAVVALPALLMVLGPRVNALKVGGIIGFVRRRRARAAAAATAAAAAHGAAGAGVGAPAGAGAGAPREVSESPFWRRVAGVVMKRPLATGLPVIALLLLLGVPFLHVSFATPDDRVLRTDASSRQVGDVIRDDFDSDIAGALETVVLGTPSPTALADYSARLSALPDVDRVEGAAGTFVDGRASAPPGPANLRFAADGASYLQVVPSVDPFSGAAQRLTRTVRAAQPPAEATVLVGGAPADLVDGKAAIADRLPLAIGLISLATFVLLFLFTGSVLLPLKAIVLNGLVMSAVLGVSVWIFQDGHLAGLFDFAPGPLDTAMPVLLFCIAFGLSMDYEMFLLSRVKEAHDAGASNTEAVATGLARTGRLVTTVAALLAVTFIAFATGSVRFMQMFGLGTALAILLDASLVRGILVPSFMRLAGGANWWAPRPLRALHARIGLAESSSPPPVDRAAAGATAGGGSPADAGVPAARTELIRAEAASEAGIAAGSGDESGAEADGDVAAEPAAGSPS